MRCMGLDVGDKTIGVAVSDLFGWTAQGIETIRRKSLNDDFRRLQELVQEYEVTEFVVGLPKNMNGTYGPRSELVMEFVRELENRLGLPAKTWDERLSTVAAQRALIEADVSRKKRKQVIDKMAAVVILQGFLDARGQG